MRLRVGDTSAEIVVSDNGKGITLPTELGDLASAGHFGLVGLSEAVTLAGGHLSLTSRPGQGMSVRASVPLSAQPGEAALGAARAAEGARRQNP